MTCGISEMAKLSGAADLVLTDVPSGRTKASFDTTPNWDDFFDSAWLALKANGALVFFVDNLRLAAHLASYPHYRYDRIWVKSIATGFFLAKKRPLRAHEFILTFWREQPTYNPQMREGFTPINAATRSTGLTSENFGASNKTTASRAGETDRYPTSVIHANCVGTTAKERVHCQQKPVPLLSELVETYTSPGDLVVDPFMGSGSTLVAARLCGRRAVGWDKFKFGDVSGELA